MEGTSSVRSSAAAFIDDVKANVDAAIQCGMDAWWFRTGNTDDIGDMPFGSYHASCEDAVNNAVRFIKEGGVDAIKLEGGVTVADKIRAISNAGIVDFGHIGLTPQSSAALGGFKVQGKNTAAAKAVIEDAIAVRSEEHTSELQSR